MIERRALRFALMGMLLAGCYGVPAATGPATSDQPSASAVTVATPVVDQSTLDPGPGASVSAPEPTIAPEPTPTPRPEPSVDLAANGATGEPIQVTIASGETVDVTLSLVTHDLDRTDCSLTHRTIPDGPGLDETTETLEPDAEQTVALRDGWHNFTARCPSIDGKLTAKLSTLAIDHLPERCAGFELPNGSPTVSTAEELQTAMVGRWHGCVTTPWVAPYWVEFTFRADGCFAAEAHEVIDDLSPPALYYGTDADDARKIVRILDVADGIGAGEMAIVFEAGGVNTDTLTDIKLAGDTLSFQFMHRGSGPLMFELVRD